MNSLSGVHEMMYTNTLLMVSAPVAVGITHRMCRGGFLVCSHMTACIRPLEPQ